MKLVICPLPLYSREVPPSVARELGCYWYDFSIDVRSSKAFLDWVNSFPGESYGIVEIPEEATDFLILNENTGDGESVIYVLDGKIIKAQVCPKTH